MASACIMSALYQLTDVAIVFFMVGLPFTIKRFFLYMGVCAIGSCIGASLGFLVGCFTSDIHRMQQVRRRRRSSPLSFLPLSFHTTHLSILRPLSPPSHPPTHLPTQTK